MGAISKFLSGLFGHRRASAVAAAQATGGPFVTGQRVAEVYEIRSVLGRGGMGIVYLGHDHATQRPVAIKAALGSFVDGGLPRQPGVDP